MKLALARRNPQREWLIAKLMVLAGAAFAAFANAWPESLVLDDRFFVGSGYYSGPGDLVLFFTDNLWAVSGFESEHYRPLLLTSIWLDDGLYGDWIAGYRMTSILLHVLVTVSVFGLVHRMLDMSRAPGTGHSAWIAFLAALVFAVHPIHAEAVNSTFNRSEVLVALSAVLGLWWFLSRLEARPASAWGGLALAYLLAMLAKESGVSLPGIAVALVLTLGRGDWKDRVRQCLPVFWLLIPLALYFFLRAQALAGPGPGDAAPMAQDSWSGGLENFAHVPEWQVLLRAAGVWGQSLQSLVWPHPLLLFHTPPTEPWSWAYLALQAAVLILAGAQARRGHYGLVIGLAIFYIALLPASRIIGAPGEMPHLAERYLYFPSVGLAVSLAFLLGWLERRFRPGIGLVPVLIAVLVLVPLGWARNADWVNSVALYESEYRNGSRNFHLLKLLTSAHVQTGNFSRIAEICDAHVDKQKADGMFSSQCATGYDRTGRLEDAKHSFGQALKDERARAQAYASLALLYLREGRRSEARLHFEQAVDAETDPAMREVRQGELLAILYPRDRARLMEAREHFEAALRLEPRFGTAQRWKRRLDRMLD